MGLTLEVHFGGQPELLGRFISVNIFLRIANHRQKGIVAVLAWIILQQE